MSFGFECGFDFHFFQFVCIGHTIQDPVGYGYDFCKALFQGGIPLVAVYIYKELLRPAVHVTEYFGVCAGFVQGSLSGYCQELTTLWVARLDGGAELKVTDPKEQQRDVEEEEAEGKERQDGVDC